MTLAGRLEKLEERLGERGRYIVLNASAHAPVDDDIIKAFLDQHGLAEAPEDDVWVIRRFAGIGDDEPMKLLMVNPKRA